jgi:hypothetical protein
LVLYHYDHFDAPGRICCMASAHDNANSTETIADILPARLARTGMLRFLRHDFHRARQPAPPAPAARRPDATTQGKPERERFPLATLFPWAAGPGNPGRRHDVHQRTDRRTRILHTAFRTGKTGQLPHPEHGPAAPSTHGVLRSCWRSTASTSCGPSRSSATSTACTRRWAKSKTYAQFITNMGRVDYLHALAWNWAWVGAVEKLAARRPGARRIPAGHHLRAEPHQLPPALVGSLPAGSGGLHPHPVRIRRPRSAPRHAPGW